MRALVQEINEAVVIGHFEKSSIYQAVSRLQFDNTPLYLIKDEAGNIVCDNGLPLITPYIRIAYFICDFLIEQKGIRHIVYEL